MAGPADGVVRGYERALPIALLRAREATMRLFKPDLDRHGLTAPQWRILRALADSGPLDATRLSELCVIQPPSLSRIFRNLAARGLIAPVAALDARRRTVALTDSGRALHGRIAATSEAIYRRLEAEFGEADMARLLALLTRLREAAARPGAE